MPCPICQSENVKFLFKNCDILFGCPGWFHLDRCRDCGHIFLREQFTPEQLGDLYTNYYPRSSFSVDNYKAYRETSGFLAWLDGDKAGCHRWVPENVRVLDIGCGFCEALGYHQARGCEVWGCEADENSKKFADRYGFNFRQGLFNPDDYEPEYFDYVTMNHVLEHTANPVEVLRSVYRVLKPGGHLIIAVPQASCIERYTFGHLWTGWQTPFHLHFFSKKSMDSACRQAGFSVIRTFGHTVSASLFAQWVLLFIHGSAGKKQAFADTTTAGHFCRKKEVEARWYVKLYRLAESLRIHCWLMRIADAGGIGMERTYFAKKEDKS